jgi:hypothetical protein
MKWDQQLGKRKYGMANESGRHVICETMTGEKMWNRPDSKEQQKKKFLKPDGIVQSRLGGTREFFWKNPIFVTIGRSIGTIDGVSIQI